MTEKQLYLSSSEYDALARPRRIIEVDWVVLDGRPCLSVIVDVPIPVREAGFPDDTTALYLTNRHVEDRATFRNLSSFPIDVYVLIPKSTAETEVTSLGQLENMYWATLYDDLKDAENHQSAPAR